MTTLCLIRHTRPDIAPGICYGRLDIDVAAGFDADAARIRSMLPATDLIVSSPLRRTRKLAEYLAPDCGFTLDDRLMEKHFGIWEGLAWDRIERSQIDAWAADLMDYAPPEGESARQLMARAESLLCDLAKLPQQNIALVAHGGSIRALLALIANIPLADTLNWDIDYGSVIFVKIQPGRTMTLFDAVGGMPTLQKVHKIFYDKIYAHDWLGQFFAGHSQQAIEDRQTSFMAEKMGSPEPYPGKEIAMVHEAMYIDRELFELRHALLDESIKEAGVQDDLRVRWLRIDAAFMQKIIKPSVESMYQNDWKYKVPVIIPKPGNK